MAEKREGIIQRDMSIIGSYFVCRKWPLAFAKVLMDYTADKLGKGFVSKIILAPAKGIKRRKWKWRGRNTT